jgi:hypothetical protein
MADAPAPDILHRLKNDMGIIIGFCDLLIADFPADDPRRADLVEVHRAALDAMQLMPEISRRMRPAREQGEQG